MKQKDSELRSQSRCAFVNMITDSQHTCVRVSILLFVNLHVTCPFFMKFLGSLHQERSSIRDTVLNSLGRITSQVDEFNSQMIDFPNVTGLNYTNAIWIKKDALRIRRNMNKIWRNNLNQRKQAFWNVLNQRKL